jgi:hypothetical protein
LNVFILCTGRCGSTTFIRACGHLTNYSAGHETRSMPGPERFAYPPDHIEADNRLSWMLGRLHRQFGEEAFYVHLRRDPAAVAASYNKRWAMGGTIIQAYDRSILRSDERSLAVVEDMVDTMEANIHLFLDAIPASRSMTLDLETVGDHFPEFLERIGAEGDREAATQEWTRLHNEGSPPTRGALRQMMHRARRIAKGVPTLLRES